MINSIQDVENLCGIRSYFNKFPIKIPFHLIKSTPENFIVKEILPNKLLADSSESLGQSEPGLFFQCVLAKKLVDTPEAVSLVSKSLKIPSDWIGYAGLKDSQGITFQRISIFNTSIESLLNLSFKNFTLSNFIRKKYEVNLGELWGNRFLLSLDCSDLDLLQNNNLQELNDVISHFGNALFPNYFGLQRFGSTRPISHIIGKSIIKQDFESAVMTYLTNLSPLENQSIFELRKNLVQDHDFDFFLSNLPRNYRYEFLMARSLKSSPNNYFKAYNELPLAMRKFFVSSFQSYIFNQMLSEYINNFDNNQEIISEFPIISYNSDFTHLPSYMVSYLDTLLKQEDISSQDFLKINNFYKVNKKQFRKTFISLTDFNFELHHQKLFLNFSLPKSSYATMIIRELR